MSLLRVITRRLSKKNIHKAELNEIWRYGLSNENGIIAADRSQNLLAIGTNKGINLIRFPRNKNCPEDIRETYLYLAQDKEKINFLKFKTGGEYLISIFDGKDLVIWNVNERNVHLQVKLSINVSSIDFYPDSNWLFLGSDNGCIYIYDVVNGILSNSSIICRTKNGESIPSLVQCLSLNPIKKRILVGFEYGLIIQYHIKKQKIIERYQQEEILTYIKWCPDGIHFVTGSDQGNLFFWKIGKTQKPLLKRSIKEYLSLSSASKEVLNKPEVDDKKTNIDTSLDIVKPIKKIEWITIDKNKTQLFCSEEVDIQSSDNKITMITLQNVEFGSPLSISKINIDENITDFDIVPYEDKPLLVTLTNKDCQFFRLEDNKEETFIYEDLSLLKLPDITKTIQTQFTKNFITNFISEEKYSESSENILFNGYVTYHKDNSMRYWLQTSYGFIFLEVLQLPKNIEIFDFLVSYDKTLIIYDNKFEIYSYIKENENENEGEESTKSRPSRRVKQGRVKLQKSKEFDSKIENFSYYKQMGIIALITKSKQLNIFSIYYDDQTCAIDAEPLLTNPVTVDLLESNVDFPILVIGNEKGQCMHYMVAQSDNKFKIQPVQDSKFNVSSKILYIKSIPAMSINEIVESAISPVEVGSASIDGDKDKSPTNEKWNIKIKEELYVVVTSSHIKVFKNKFSDQYDSIKLDYEPVFSYVVEIDGLKFCICISLNEDLEIYMNFYSIPKLNLVRITKFPTNDLASFDSISITPTGLMIIWFKGNEFKQYFVWGKEVFEEEKEAKSSHSVTDSFNELISPYSAKSQSWSVDYDEELSYSIPKPRRASIREIDTLLKKNLEITSPNTEISPINLDSLSTDEKTVFGKKKLGLGGKVFSKSDSQCDKVRKEKVENTNITTLTKTTDNIYSQTIENIQERGERLDELGDQANQLNQGANDFLRNVREYNERMSKKKWYQL
ncbi:WD40 repeat-like protein [Neocallimastix lanati (nom. inval.)]|nr:WD40 repeat-like protein [Neocallimastix sp. JGI-2020a]